MQQTWNDREYLICQLRLQTCRQISDSYLVHFHMWTRSRFDSDLTISNILALLSGSHVHVAILICCAWEGGKKWNWVACTMYFKSNLRVRSVHSCCCCSQGSVFVLTQQSGSQETPCSVCLQPVPAHCVAELTPHASDPACVCVCARRKCREEVVAVMPRPSSPTLRLNQTDPLLSSSLALRLSCPLPVKAVSSAHAPATPSACLCAHMHTHTHTT